MLRIAQDAYDRLRQHGEASYPHECCGVLMGTATGDNRVVRQAIPVENASRGDRRVHYEIAPEDVIRIEREARRGGDQVVGFYHSHPDHPAQWSATDLAEAHWLGCCYVITEVAQGKAAVTNSFLLAGTSEEDKRFEMQTIEVQEKR